MVAFVLAVWIRGCTPVTRICKSGDVAGEEKKVNEYIYLYLLFFFFLFIDIVVLKLSCFLFFK